jgi:purine-binding chemotaxis protein CheW
VDNVHDVVEIAEDKIEKTPEVGFKFKSKYLYGIVQLGERMVLILNLDGILTTEEVVEMSGQVEKV